MEKKKLPASVTYDMTGKLPGLYYDWPAIIGDCRNAIVQNTKYVVTPVPEPHGTKKNKVRMDRDDKRSPLGLVMKQIDNYSPYAAARFDPEEVVKWAVERFIELSEEEQQEFITDMETQDSP